MSCDILDPVEGLLREDSQKVIPEPICEEALTRLANLEIALDKAVRIQTALIDLLELRGIICGPDLVEAISVVVQEGAGDIKRRSEILSTRVSVPDAQ